MTPRWYRRPIPIVLGVSTITLFVSYALKECPANLWGHDVESILGLQCYTDIVGLWFQRNLDAGTFPYVHGHLNHGELAGGALEYPVLTGLFMWAVSTVVATSGDYYRLSVVLLTAPALATSYLLARMAGWRALLWAAAPALVLYAFVNWELLVVPVAVVGLCLHCRGRPAWAALAFGIGGALKWFPLLFVGPLSVERWLARDRRGAATCVLVGFGSFALVNLPFVVASPTGWYATYQFHSLREPNYDTIWKSGVPALGPHTIDLVSGVGTAAFLVAALVAGPRRHSTFPFLQVCAAMLAAFLLWSKVHSSQYALWIMPFFVLLSVSVGWWLAYSVADFARFLGTLLRDSHADLAHWLITSGVWARAALLAALFVVFLRARPAPAAFAPAALPSAVAAARRTSRRS